MVKDIAIGTEVSSSIPWRSSLALCCQGFANVVMFVRDCVTIALSSDDWPATSFTLWRDTTSIMKI